MQVKRAKKPKAKRVKKEKPSPILSPAKPGDVGPWEVVIPNWLPPSLNVLLSSHWAARARKKEAAEAIIAIYCKQQNIPLADTKRRVDIEVRLPKGVRAPDHDNIEKVVNDGLVKAGALVNDSHLWIKNGDYIVTRPAGLATCIKLRRVEP